MKIEGPLYRVESDEQNKIKWELQDRKLRGPLQPIINETMPLIHQREFVTFEQFGVSYAVYK